MSVQHAHHGVAKQLVAFQSPNVSFGLRIAAINAHHSCLRVLGGWHRQNLNPTLFKSTSPCRAERSLLLPQAFPAEVTSSWSPGDVQQHMGWLRLFVPARMPGRVRSPVLRGFPVVMGPPSVRGPPSEG